MESKAQVRPLGIQPPPPQGTCPGPARPKSQKGIPWEGVWWPSPRGSSAWPLCRLLHDNVQAVLLLREATSSPGGRLPERGRRPGERPGLVPIPVLLASSLPGREGVLGCSGKEPALLARSQPVGGKGLCTGWNLQSRSRLGLRELLTGLGFSGFPPFCQIPLGPGGC